MSNLILIQFKCPVCNTVIGSNIAPDKDKDLIVQNFRSLNNKLLCPKHKWVEHYLEIFNIDKVGQKIDRSISNHTEVTNDQN